MTYALPTMDEVRAAPWNGLRAASLFAGAGGSSLGYRMAGWRVVYANEMDDHACDTYERNRAEYTVLDRRSINGLDAERNVVGEPVRGEDILAAVRADGGDELDLLDGSPPCQDFSLAGRRDMSGPNARLYYEAVRLVGEARPRAFAFENVKGMGQGRAVGHMVRIVDALKAEGYRVRRGVLDFSRLGVPQARERLLVIGFREDTGIDPALGFPTLRRRRTTVNDALPHVGHFAPAPTLTKGGFDERLDGWTVSGGVRRALTPDELRRISSFPDDFAMEGSDTDKRNRLGNSVPPLAARAWGERIRDALLEVDGAAEAVRSMDG